MNSLAYIPASDGAANASLMTVTNVRSPLATTIQVNTVANAPTKFYASMGTPNTYTDPVTGETITIISEATAVDFAGTIDGSNVEIVEIAPGYTDNGSEVGDIIVIRPVTEWANNVFNVLSVAHNDDGTLSDLPYLINNFVYSGGIVSQSTGLTGTFSDITYYIGSNRHTATGIASKVYAASKDTYVDIDADGDVSYTEVANGAAAPALAANNIRIAKVVTSGAAITSVVQGGYDSLNNLIRPRGGIGATQRSGGMRTGVIPSATLNTTGNKSITGLGFRPKTVEFIAMYPDGVGSSNNVPIANGAMDESGSQWTTCGSVRNGNGGSTRSTTSHCLVVYTIAAGGGSDNINLRLNYVSMDDDGFTINCNNSTNAMPVAYKAYA